MNVPYSASDHVLYDNPQLTAGELVVRLGLDAAIASAIDHQSLAEVSGKTRAASFWGRVYEAIRQINLEVAHPQ